MYFNANKNQLIPARGRKHFSHLLSSRTAANQLIPARGRKPDGHPLRLYPLFLNQLIPARGRKLDSCIVPKCRSDESTHPRKGTETHPSWAILGQITRNQLIPARGRKPISPHDISSMYTGINSSPQGDGNQACICIRVVVLESTHPRKGTETRAQNTICNWENGINSSPQEDGNIHFSKISAEVYGINSSPQGDGNFTQRLCFYDFIESTHPRKGTETLESLKHSHHILNQLIPARGRKHFA